MYAAKGCMTGDFTNFVGERAISTIWCVAETNIKTPLIGCRAMAFIFDQTDAAVSLRARA